MKETMIMFAAGFAISVLVGLCFPLAKVEPYKRQWHESKGEIKRKEKLERMLKRCDPETKDWIEKEFEK